MRKSGYNGTGTNSDRKHIVVAPDAYVKIQGSTTLTTCGDCGKKLNLNKYLTSLSVNASVESAPGSSSVSLSVPDTDVGDMYVDGQLVIKPMMEIEIYAKGYYAIGGIPQYYRIFWGLISSVTKSWNGGTTNVSISCKDILRWWEVTQVTKRPAFLSPQGSSSGNYTDWQNQFAGLHPYAVMVNLARDAIGDVSETVGSFLSYEPEKGGDIGKAIGSYMRDISIYWQTRFQSIQNSLVLYGSSGNAYRVSGIQGNKSPRDVAKEIFKKEKEIKSSNDSTDLYFVNTKDMATYKQELSMYADVEFFQVDSQSKLQIANACKDQMFFEFYCDTTGDIIFKPPFYNMNTMPNKPVSWIFDFEIIETSITENEESVITHLTSHGNAFGGVFDPGLNDEITTPNTGVIDYHLLKQYGWRKSDVSVEWAGNPKKLYYHLLDYMDRLNAKRTSATITIPMRPELRIGFPIWVPMYDSFFYLSGIDHSYNVGGQCTSTLTLTAKRSKFIAQKNIGSIKRNKTGETIRSNDESLSVIAKKTGNDKEALKKSLKSKDVVYEVEFSDGGGDTTGIGSNSKTGPMYMRDTKTGKLLGCPNVVMVYRNNITTGKLIDEKTNAQTNANKSKINDDLLSKNNYNYTTKSVVNDLASQDAAKREVLIDRLRNNRYASSMTNAGVYDYAIDITGDFKEIQVVPVDKFKSKDVYMTSGAESKASIDTYNADKKKLSTDKQKQEKTLNEYKSKLAKLAASGKDLSDSDFKEVNDKVVKQEEELKLTTNKLSSLGEKKFVPNLYMMVRPVSDEFGFELIGHNRYGRGVYVEYNQLIISDDTTIGVSNDVSIPFSQTMVSPNDASLVNSTSKLESMQPEDYLTGSYMVTSDSSYKDERHVSGMTSRKSYDTLSNSDSFESNSYIFAETDSLKRAVTLSELTPNIENDAYSQKPCSCGLSKSEWWSLLPTSEITKIVGNNGVYFKGLTEYDADLGVVSTNDAFSDNGKTFFAAMADYMKKEFKRVYDSNNAVREKRYSGEGAFAQNDPYVFGVEQTNSFGQPSHPLFARASAGDPDALKAMAAEANFDFGLTGQSLSNIGKIDTTGVDKSTVGTTPSDYKS